MLYFRKINCLQTADKNLLSLALQKTSVEKKFPLDFIPATNDIDLDKKFLRFENKNGFQFARLRSSFEKTLPKLIIYLPKDETHNFYQIRFSWPTLIVFVIIAALLPLLVWKIISESKDSSALLGICILLIAYPFWTLAELHFIDCKVKEAIKEH